MSTSVCPSCFATKRCDCGMDYMPSDVLRRGLQRQVRGGFLYLAVGGAVLVVGVVLLVVAYAFVWPVLAGGAVAIFRGGQMLADGRTRLRELAHYVPELPKATVV